MCKRSDEAEENSLHYTACLFFHSLAFYSRHVPLKTMIIIIIIIVRKPVLGTKVVVHTD